MANALVGCTGFVGSSLLKQTAFDALFHSTDIADIENSGFDLLVCAGAPAAKWAANKDPDSDLANLSNLMNRLRTVRCRRAILISTIDVYPIPAGVDERSTADSRLAQPYGKHRRLLEEFFESQFESVTIVRLPGLVGPGLRKNFLFDLKQNRALGMVDRDSRFQFYDMRRLWQDILRVIHSDLSLVNFATEPVSAWEAAVKGFGVEFNNRTEKPPVNYDMQTLHASAFGLTGRYLATAEDVFDSIRTYATS